MNKDSKYQKLSAPVEPKHNRTWLILTVLVGVWMFFLGLLIGRGNVGPQFDTRQMEKELESLKLEFIKKQEKLSEIIKNQTEGSNVLESLKKTDNKPEPLPPEIVQKNQQRRLDEAQLREAGTVTNESESERMEPAAAPAPKEQATPHSDQPSVPQPPVEQQPTTDTALIPQPPPKPETVAVTIQVASVQDPQEAIKIVTELKHKGFSAYTTPVYLAGKGVWYRVRVGRFSLQPEAQEVLKQLGAKGHSGVIVKQ
jgi:cell division septation protein DedD